MEKLTSQKRKQFIRNNITIMSVTKDELRQEYNEIFDKLKEYENADAKQEVAREIFEEIEKPINAFLSGEGFDWEMADKIAELEKKYIGE